MDWSSASSTWQCQPLRLLLLLIVLLLLLLLLLILLLLLVVLHVLLLLILLDPRFISSPLFGHYLPRLGLKRVLRFGVLTTAVCALLFGLLTFLPSTGAFLGASYGLRVLEGVAEAGAWAAVLTLIADVYEEEVTWVYSLTQVPVSLPPSLPQASFGFAEILGPSLGGVLYEASYILFLLPRSLP
jgi:MFS family permease